MREFAGAAEVFCRCDPEVAPARMRARHAAGRHPIHRDVINPALLEKLAPGPVRIRGAAMVQAEGSALHILVVVEELASKEKTQAPPAWVVWDALADPGHPGSHAWLDLADDEVVPKVLEASRPALVVWSSLWPDRPGDQIRFELRPKDGGCAVRWRLLTPDTAPPAEVLKHLRHRLNFLINGKLRATFDL